MIGALGRKKRQHIQVNHIAHIMAFLPCANHMPSIDRQYATNEGVECVFFSSRHSSSVSFLNLFHTLHKYFVKDVGSM